MRAIRGFLASVAIGSYLAFTPQLASPQDAIGAESHSARSTPRTNGPPNIILILADDFGIEGVNIYGGEYYTPNIDRLAQEGVRFDNAHSTPLCSPSRVRIMTGVQNYRNYEAFGYLAPGQRTFGNVLQDAGYTTGMVGKWQLMGNGFDGRVGITPEAAGFHESYLWQLNALDGKGSRYWGPTHARNGRTIIHEEGFGPDYEQRAAFDFISRHREEPFFLYYSTVLPHAPFVPTPASLTADGEQDRFSGMVSYMDRLIGDLMEKLKEEGLDENTVVIFTGDNGTDQDIMSTRSGYEIPGGKGLPTINGTHVPMIVWAPGRVPQGLVRQGLFDFVDMLPTLAEIASEPVSPQAIDGFSQWKVITGHQETVRQSIFMHYAPAWQFEPARFVFDASWKLYGDGRFVSMDPVSGVETELSVATLSGEALSRYSSFHAILAGTDDGPLDQTRYPWCEGQESLDPDLPSTVAGCKNYPG